MNRTGIFHWYGYIQPFEERIKQIKKTGFDYVMLWWEDERYPNFIDRKDLIKIVKSFELELDNVHLPFDDINLLWSEGDSRLKATDQFKRWMNECKESGAETVVMHVSKDDNISLNLSLGYKSFNALVKEAENIKLNIAFENTQMINYLDFILEEFKSYYARFCYDSSHDFINKQTCGKILEKWKDRLQCVHLSDCDGISDKHWIPGSGIVDWKDIISIVNETNCNSFSMETYPSEKEKSLKPLEFLSLARNNLIPLL